MINSLEANIDDCCYFLLRNDRKPRFGTIVRTLPEESAVQVIDSQGGGYYVVWEKNAAWDEKELKGQKWEKPHNYIREIPKEILDEKEQKPSKRVSNVRDGKKKTTKRKRTKRKSSSVSKRASSKS